MAPATKLLKFGLRSACCSPCTARPALRSWAGFTQRFQGLAPDQKACSPSDPGNAKRPAASTQPTAQKWETLVVTAPFPTVVCASPTQSASPSRLSTPEAERRFGICRTSIREQCWRHPEIAIQEHGKRGPTGWHWMVDGAALAAVLGDRIDRAAAARRFHVPRSTFDGLPPDQLGTLLATLPLAKPRKRRPPRIPPDAAAAQPGEVRNAAG